MEAPSMMERRLAGAFVQTVFLRDRRGGPWLPPAHLTHQPVEFEGNTGAKISGTWFSAAKPRGAVVLAHPDKRYAKHWFVKEGYVDFLLANGYDVLTFDFTGYGESRGPATYYHEDLVAAARFAEHWAGGFPVHVLGVSMGAFATANASPKLDFVHALILESPYPSFNAWYGKGPYLGMMKAFDAIFPRTARSIQADQNIPHAAAHRVLIAYSPKDEVTAPSLSQEVIAAAPSTRTTSIEVDAPHLHFLQDARYREALLATLAG